MMNKIVTRTAEFSFVEEQIFLCKLLPDKEIDVADTQENFEAIIKISEKKPYLILVDGRAQLTITKEAMENGARPEMQLNMVARAILIKSLPNRLIGNFIIKFHKSAAPTKLFTDQKSAMQWLKENIDKNRTEDRLALLDLN